MHSFVQKSVTSVKTSNGRRKTKFSVTKGTDGHVHKIEGTTSSNHPNNILVHESIRKLNQRTGMIRSSNHVFKMKSSDIMNLLKESDKSRELIDKKVIKAKKLLKDTTKVNNKKLDVLKTSKKSKKPVSKKVVVKDVLQDVVKSSKKSVSKKDVVKDVVKGVVKSSKKLKKSVSKKNVVKDAVKNAVKDAVKGVVKNVVKKLSSKKSIKKSVSKKNVKK
jgi:hypothetical protein